MDNEIQGFDIIYPKQSIYISKLDDTYFFWCEFAISRFKEVFQAERSNTKGNLTFKQLNTVFSCTYGVLLAQIRLYLKQI